MQKSGHSVAQLQPSRNNISEKYRKTSKSLEKFLLGSLHYSDRDYMNHAAYSDLTWVHSILVAPLS